MVMATEAAHCVPRQQTKALRLATAAVTTDRSPATTAMDYLPGEVAEGLQKLLQPNHASGPSHRCCFRGHDCCEGLEPLQGCRVQVCLASRCWGLRA